MSNYLIIGGSSGIGQQLSTQLVASGHRVFATYNSHPLSSDNASLSYHPLNILDENIVLDFLPDSIDGLVFCPGAISLRPFARIKPEEFIADFNLQVIGAVKVIQASLPKLKLGNNPAIVLYSTVAVQLGLNFHTQVAISKGAIEGLTRSLAAELAPTIRVNCIAPSLTDTPLAANLLNSEQKVEANALRHPLKRVGTASDIANMTEFLLSDKSTWITGQIFHVDGGMSSVKL
jgi:NAD(P)-dependent dehydrogenase (short-subunit alcohol dehydrogenase family)